MGCTYCFLMKKELINLPILTSVGHKPQCIFAHVLLLWISIGLHLSIITLGESSLFVWICCDIWSLGRSESWHWWKIDVKARSQLGQLMDRSILRSSPCSFGCSMSQRLRSETVQFPSTCWIWIRYFGDDCACLSTNTLRGGTLIGASILNLLVIWPPPKLFESKSADSEDGKQRLSVGVWVISLLYGWGGFSQADWGCSKWAGLSQAESCSFLFSRNCFLRLAFLLRVEGDFFLASDGVRAEAMISFPLLSKEKENDPEVIWILKPIFWLTSAWVKAKHCVSRKWSFPITRGAAILTVRSGRDFRRAHAAPRVRILLNGARRAFYKICKVCGKEGTGTNIKGHIETNHLQGVSIPCNFCDEMFVTGNSLRQHKNTAHGGNNGTKEDLFLDNVFKAEIIQI